MFSPQTPLPPRLPHNIEQSSLCYTVGPCWLSILNRAVCTCPSQLPMLDIIVLTYLSNDHTLKHEPAFTFVIFIEDPLWDWATCWVLGMQRWIWQVLYPRGSDNILEVYVYEWGESRSGDERWLYGESNIWIWPWMDLDGWRWQRLMDLICTRGLRNWWHRVPFFSSINSSGVMALLRSEYSTYLEPS